MPAGIDAYDIYSKHYPSFDGDLTSQDFPKLNDECTHIACYDADTLKRDPGVSDYWGHFIKRFWENCYTSEGCLGGAIWARLRRSVSAARRAGGLRRVGDRG